MPLVALVLWSLSDSLARALFLAVMMLPGVLFFKYLVGDISFAEGRRRGVLHTIYFVAIVMLIEYQGIFFVYLTTSEYPFPTSASSTSAPPAIVMNPLFIWLMLGALLSFEWLLRSKLLGGAEPPRQQFITFFSDRRRTTLEINTIRYIESRDEEVRVVTDDGASYPTRMKISQWEAALDERFARVHRSFIVGRQHITRVDSHTVWLGEFSIEMSRKYRDSLSRVSGFL